MIKAGLCSVCFKPKAPEEVIELAKKAGLSAIEWIGSVHVPAGDVRTAEEVGKMTRDAGLISTYGSIFHLGTGEDITPHLEACSALGARDMRIWAGNGKPSCDMTSEERRAFVEEAKDASRRAAELGIKLSVECHDGGLTDCAESQLRFLREVDEENFCTYWQEILNLPESAHLPSLSAVHTSGKLTNIHVYQYRVFDGGREMLPLSDGFEKWRERFDILKNDSTDRLALIEYVRNYTEDILAEDAKTLCALIKASSVIS